MDSKYYRVWTWVGRKTGHWEETYIQLSRTQLPVRRKGVRYQQISKEEYDRKRIQQIVDGDLSFSNVGKEVSYGCFSATKTEPCHCGNGTLTIHGHFGIGEKLMSGYTPLPGELVKNDYMECDTCNFNQGS